MEKHPFEKLLNQIAEIMQYAYDNAHKPIPEEQALDADKKLDEIEQQILAFKELSEQALENGKVSEYTLDAMMADDKHEKITPEERDILLRAEYLKTEAQKASNDVLVAARDLAASGERLTETPAKEKKVKSPQARKGKFKSMGGYKNWKPL